METPSNLPAADRARTPDVELCIFRLRTQGNACAFVFPDSTLGVVDWGAKDIAPFIKLLDDTHGSRIRFVVATHAHSDHTKGLEPILRECVRRSIPVGALFYPAIGRLRLGPYDYLGKAAVYAMKQGIKVHPVSVGDFPAGKIQPPPFLDKTDDWEVSILAPPSSTNNRHQLASHLREINPGNMTSLVLLFAIWTMSTPSRDARCCPATRHLPRYSSLPISPATTLT